MNRYVFLDIDGVLNSERTVYAYKRLIYAGMMKDKLSGNAPPNPYFDPVAVNLLRYAQEITEFKIVISSSWRYTFNTDDFHKLFDYYDWDTRNVIIGATGFENGSRGKQIKCWLDNYGKFPYEYVILDDSTDMLDEQKDFFIETDFIDGFSYKNFVDLLKAFGYNNESIINNEVVKN